MLYLLEIQYNSFYKRKTRMKIKIKALLYTTTELFRRRIYFRSQRCKKIHFWWINLISTLVGARGALEFQRENKSRYVTENFFQLGPADVIFGGEKRRPETRLCSQAMISSVDSGPKFAISCYRTTTTIYTPTIQLLNSGSQRVSHRSTHISARTSPWTIGYC